MVEDQALDHVYGALADPTRRRILTRLRGGEARITDLARDEPVSFAAVARHVKVLEDAGLISRQVRGRDHWLALEPSLLGAASRWIDEQRAFWETRADALSAKLDRRRRA
jgi:DNA-binding transcriptional ArsR family regulator